MRESLFAGIDLSGLAVTRCRADTLGRRGYRFKTDGEPDGRIRAFRVFLDPQDVAEFRRTVQSLVQQVRDACAKEAG